MAALKKVEGNDVQQSDKDLVALYQLINEGDRQGTLDAYEKLNFEYEESEDAAKNVSDRIDKVESVAEALFIEWEEELEIVRLKY